VQVAVEDPEPVLHRRLLFSNTWRSRSSSSHPRFVRRADGAPNQPVIRIGDIEIAEMSKRARTAVVGKSLEPLWSAIEELGVPVGFHPTGQSSLRDDIARRYIDTPNGRVIGVAGRNPIELMMAFGSMAAGGALERHPGLRCAFLEGTCGWLSWYLWRLDEAWEKFGPGSEMQISQLPSQYFFRQCYIATDADEKPPRQVVEAIGDDNIVVSTDYPHSDGLFPVAIEEFVRLEGVSDKSKANILWDNCARLYKLPVST
jgi:predicted TIM-barrel fold metal-dependent hydrolase